MPEGGTRPGRDPISAQRTISGELQVPVLQLETRRSGQRLCAISALRPWALRQWVLTLVIQSTNDHRLPKWGENYRNVLYTADQDRVDVSNTFDVEQSA